jgi:hypothetical protein
MDKEKHIGSSFDEFLGEEGLYEEVEEVATKRVSSFKPKKETDQSETLILRG